ncbi:MAG: hypothetical protein L3J93_02010 [Thermoplasmata archaeon]|nr:hypothetical protein [Thermoplasmata archaeon]
MARRTATSLHDKQQTLVEARAEATAEVARLAREEQFLIDQVRQAQEQVRYYEGLLAKLRRDWGRPERLPQIVRRLG